MPAVVITEFMDREGVDLIAARFDTVYDPDLVDRPQALDALLADCRGLIVRNRTQVRPPLLAKAPHLKTVGRLGVGLDNIDLGACAGAGISVLPATGTNDETVAEFVMGALLSLTRGGAFQATADVAAGTWPRTRFKARDAKGLRLGLIGFGAIARQVARRARAFGIAVAAYDPFVSEGDPAWALADRRCADVGTLLDGADILSIHVPLTDATRHLVDAAALARLPAGAVLINTARGGIVDEHAMVAALKSGALGGAMLDVMEAEPVAAGSHLAGVPNLLLSPHIAGITKDAVLRASLLVADNVARVLEGGTPTVADAARGR
ncbi:NAD(P)-dependent oxidoreductase [Xanthobacter sp. KR7-225]|uniref:NAD(P)-dependent oxidoreductase n=1 Tax=Xanthobacter sp. KR7-225 TaxID=3156613 RepID=UPI0032B518AF